jgi:hypothetical protein
VQELEPRQVPVLQVLEVLQQHDVAAGAVAVEQQHLGALGQRGGGDGEDRRDAAAGRDQAEPGAGQRAAGAERPRRRQRLHDVTGLQAQHPRRHEPAGQHLGPDPQRPADG